MLLAPCLWWRKQAPLSDGLSYWGWFYSCYQNLGVVEEAELLIVCTAETFSLIPAESSGGWHFFLMPKAWRGLAWCHCMRTMLGLLYFCFCPKSCLQRVSRNLASLIRIVHESKEGFDAQLLMFYWSGSSCHRSEKCLGVKIDGK